MSHISSILEPEALLLELRKRLSLNTPNVTQCFRFSLLHWFISLFIASAWGCSTYISTVGAGQILTHED